MKTLGAQGDIVTVKDGYANNYLFPRALAVMATASNIKILEENTRQGTLRREKMKADAQTLAEKLQGMTINIGVKAGANGKIFGSVTPLQVSQVLKTHGYDIDRRKIEVSDIKMVGNYEATVNLHRDVAINITLDIVAE
jgi:large subunit ribosomal protein L9